MTASWLALHVFYGDDQDRAIVDSIGPTLRRLRANGTIDRYFFIRYWNGGPHLRIRAECLHPLTEVEQELRQEMLRFMRETPPSPIDTSRYNAEAMRIHSVEQRLAGNEIAMVEPLETIRPSGAIETRAYRFDEARYGGPWAVQDAHDHALVSTEIACALLELTSVKPGLRRVFGLHAAAVVPGILEANNAAALQYFTRCSNWEAEFSNSDPDRGWEKNGFLSYAKQGEALDDVRALIDGRNPVMPEFWISLLKLWREELKRRHQFLVNARRTQSLQVDADYLILDAMHLFLNRLGLGLTVECYMYYLIAGMLRDRIAEMRHDQAEGASL